MADYKKMSIEELQAEKSWEEGVAHTARSEQLEQLEWANGPDAISSYYAAEAYNAEEEIKKIDKALAALAKREEGPPALDIFAARRVVGSTLEAAWGAESRGDYETCKRRTFRALSQLSVLCALKDGPSVAAHQLLAGGAGFAAALHVLTDAMERADAATVANWHAENGPEQETDYHTPDGALGGW